MSVVVGVLGSACDRLTTHLEDIPGYATERIINKTALLGTAEILQNFLS